MLVDAGSALPVANHPDADLGHAQMQQEVKLEIKTTELDFAAMEDDGQDLPWDHAATRAEPEATRCDIRAKKGRARKEKTQKEPPPKKRVRGEEVQREIVEHCSPSRHLPDEDHLETTTSPLYVDTTAATVKQEPATIQPAAGANYFDIYLVEKDSPGPGHCSRHLHLHEATTGALDDDLAGTPNHEAPLASSSIQMRSVASPPGEFLSKKTKRRI